MEVTITQEHKHIRYEVTEGDEIKAQQVLGLGATISVAMNSLVGYTAHEKACYGAIYQHGVLKKKELEFCQDCGYVGAPVKRCPACNNTTHFGVVIIEENEQ